MPDQLYIVSSGQTSSGLVVELESHTSVAILQVESGGTAIDNTIGHQGFLWVRNGGVATSTVVQSGGTAGILEGGVASNMVLNAYGYVYISGPASDAIVNSKASLFVNGKGIASGRQPHWRFDHRKWRYRLGVRGKHHRL